MGRKNIHLILFLILAIVSLLLYMYVFNVYEVNVIVTPAELFADGKSTVKIEAVPLNSFGKRAPFRNVSAEFEITEGKHLVTIVSADKNKGIMILRSKFDPGIVTVIIKPEKSLLPTLVEIPVNPNFADANKF